jgi:Sugar (and other) transporter
MSSLTISATAATTVAPPSSSSNTNLLFEMQDDSYINMNNINNNNITAPQQEQPPQQRGVFREWLYDSVWPGLGLFGESFMLFSIGIMVPIWQQIFPNCFFYAENTGTCSARLLHSLSLAVVTGLILGMLSLGLLTAAICGMGRRRGSIVTASLMSCGALGLTLTSFVFVHLHRESAKDDSVVVYADEPFLVKCMALSLFIFGIGVGGEYPMAAASASEKAMERLHQRNMKIEEQSGKQESMVMETVVEDHSRGCKVQLVFTMQGMGIFCNSLLMTVLLLIYRRDADVDNYYYSPDIVVDLVFIWRTTYSLGTFVLLGVLISRCLYLQESSVWKEQQEQARDINEQQQQQQEVEQLQQQQQQQQQSTTTTTTASTTTLEAATTAASRAIIDETVGVTTTTQKTAALQKSPSMISTVSSLSLPSVVDDSYIQLFLLNQGNSIRRRGTEGSGTVTPGCGSPTPAAALPIVQELQDPEEDDDGDQSRSSLHNTNKNNISSFTMEPGQQQQRHPRQQQERSSRWKLLRLFTTNYGVRLFGASACWLLWDVAFYGNKLFQSTFILALTGAAINNNNNEQADNNNGDDDYEQTAVPTITTTLLKFSAAATLNAGVALCGYFTAALLVDHPRLGRRGLQLTGFAVTGLLFVLCAFLYPTASPTTLVILYFTTSFFGQVGPNCTTFLLPAEIFPTAVRTQCHGIAAASGKVGALIAAFWFPHLATVSSSSGGGGESSDSAALDLFLVSGYASLAACAITYWTIPETAGLDLYEMDKKWSCIVQGNKGDYHGAANQAQFLSPYERFKLLLRRQQASHYNHAADAY